ATSALARAGITGIAGRTLARVGAGAITGAATQAPIVGLEAGLAPEEASEMGLAAAMREIGYGAAGFATMHAVGGALGDLLGREPRPASPAPTPPIGASPELAEAARPIV